MFQDKLRQLRLENDMSQEDLAEIMGVTRQSISKYENGTAEPSYEKLAIIVEYFDVTYDYLLEGTYSGENKSQEAKKTSDKKTKQEQAAIFVASPLLDEDENQAYVAFETVIKPTHVDLDFKPDAVLLGIPRKTSSIFKPKKVELAWYRTIEEADREKEAIEAALEKGEESYELEYFVPVKRYGFFSVQYDD